MNGAPPLPPRPDGPSRDGVILAELEGAALDSGRSAEQRALFARAAAALRGAQDDALVELRFREVVENVQQGIVVRDQTGSAVYVNREALRMFDQKPVPEAAFPGGGPDLMFIDERGREVPAEQLPSALALSGNRPAGPQVLGMFDRTARTLAWVNVTAVPHGDGGDGRPRFVMTFYTDITGLKRDSALFLRAQALASIGGWEWDTGRDRLYLTREARRILGRDPAPSTSDELLECLVEPDRRRLRQALEAAVERGWGFGLELQGVRSGRPFWMRVMAEVGAHGPLSARITGTVQDVTRQKQDEETLRVQARTDPLTGLLNRDAIRAELAERLADPGRARLAVLYVDLDRFKTVNDVLGHAAGDRLLVAAADRIRRVVGTDGLLARLGGDEFLLVCPMGDDPDHAVALAERILASFDASFRVQGEEFAVTASIGLAFAPEAGPGAQLMIQNADAAMYASKRRGRNGWQVFTPELAAQQQRRLQVETQLRNAVSNGEFDLVFQPQVELATGRTVAAEALLRWNNPTLGAMQPDEFIDLAENTGDVVGIGNWVLRESCRQLCRWRQRGIALERVAVNVSYRQFLAGDLAERVAEALRECGLTGDMLELELTERVLVEDVPETAETFAALHALGVRLSIDDFGEGYSALNYLRRLPIHGLKLSQLFVQGVPGNASDVAVSEAVIGIARSLRLGLLAEGVETSAQRDFLVQRGVVLGQGFLYAPGLGADEFEARFGSNAAVT